MAAEYNRLTSGPACILITIEAAVRIGPGASLALDNVDEAMATLRNAGFAAIVSEDVVEGGLEQIVATLKKRTVEQ